MTEAAAVLPFGIAAERYLAPFHDPKSRAILTIRLPLPAASLNGLTQFSANDP